MREVTRHSSSEVGWATSVLRRRTADGEKEKREAAWRGRGGDGDTLDWKETLKGRNRKGKIARIEEGEIGGFLALFALFGFLEDFTISVQSSDFLEGGRIPITFFI